MIVIQKLNKHINILYIIFLEVHLLLIYLFPLLWGALVSLILCSPYHYYPVFIVIFIVSIIIFIFSRKLFKHKGLKFYLYSLIPIFISYSFCSYIIFKPSDFNYIYNKNISSNKKAVIFYCQGEMEKYSPKYANYFFKDDPFFLKPIHAFNIKRLYRDVDVKNKNKDLLLVAKDVKNSIMNYKPYYFYIALSRYFPDIKAAIQTAINDGCSEITIVNYSNIDALENEISGEIKVQELRNNALVINFTKPIYNSENFADGIVSQVLNTSLKYDGILLLDKTTDTSKRIKSLFVNVGYEDKSIIISSNIGDSMNYFKQNNINNILYINLGDSNGGLQSEVLLPRKFEKYNDKMKITGISNWGYDKNFVKAVINEIKKTTPIKGGH